MPAMIVLISIQLYCGLDPQSSLETVNTVSEDTASSVV